MHAAVTLHIDAPPEKVWGLISDITKMGEYSPEVFEAEWLDGATGPAVGAHYRGHVKRNEMGPTLLDQCKVTECVPGEVFEFAVVMRDKPVNTWRYEFAASGDGHRRHRVVPAGRQPLHQALAPARRLPPREPQQARHAPHPRARQGRRRGLSWLGRPQAARRRATSTRARSVTVSITRRATTRSSVDRSA